MDKHTAASANITREVGRHVGPRLPSFRFYLLMCVVVASAIGSLYRDELLPQRFLYDSHRLRQFIQFPEAMTKDGSYRATALLWRIVADGGHDRLVAVATFSIYCAVLFWLSPPRLAVTASVAAFGIYMVAVPLGAIFVAGYTKEIFVAIMLVAMVNAPKSLVGELFGVGLVVAYGFAVRPYWLIAAALYFCLRLVNRSRNPVVGYLSVAAVSLTVLSVAFPIWTGYSLDHYRTLVLDEISISPDSTISGPLSGADWVSQSSNSIAILLQMQAPVHLLVGTATQVAGGTIILAIWVQFWRNLACSGRQGIAADRSADRAFGIVFAVLITLTVFEPDYGSYLRHLVPLLPVLCYLSISRSQANGKACSALF